VARNKVRKVGSLPVQGPLRNTNQIPLATIFTRTSSSLTLGTGTCCICIGDWMGDAKSQDGRLFQPFRVFQPLPSR
jgi:hypothetical protein